MDEPALHLSSPGQFKDTEFVRHDFADGSFIESNVVPSSYSIGSFAIDLNVTDENGKRICDITLDRFSALCLSDVITKALLNQEEAQVAAREELNRAMLSRLEVGQGEEDKQSDDAIRKDD